MGLLFLQVAVSTNAFCGHKAADTRSKECYEKALSVNIAGVDGMGDVEGGRWRSSFLSSTTCVERALLYIVQSLGCVKVTLQAGPESSTDQLAT